MPKLLVFATAVAALHAGIAPTAAAQAPTSEDSRDQEARGLFEAGRAAYSDRRFDEALEYFERAHALSGRDVMYNNIGMAAERAGNRQRAIEAFELYVARVPDAENRRSVENRLDVLRARQAADATAAEREQSAGEGADPGPWVLVAVGGAATAGGVVMYVLGALGIERVSAAPDGAPWAEYEGDHETGPILANIGIAVGAAGLATVTLGVVLLATAGGDEDAAARLRLRPNGVSVEGQF